MAPASRTLGAGLFFERPLLKMMSKKAITAWCFYDWANSAFATTVMAAMFPPFYRELVLAAGLSGATATAYWGYTTAAALALVAISAPVLGAIADKTGSSKRLLGVFAGAGIILTGAFVFIGEGNWQLASLLFLGANIGFAGSIIFYESLLPFLAPREQMDRISTRGYGLGYAGGGCLLIINVLWVLKPDWFGMSGAGFAVKASFLSVAIWWAVFSLPLFRHVSEPERQVSGIATTGNLLRAGFSSLAKTLREITRYRQVFIFLIAYWIYNDGIGTIIKMATAYGSEIGIGLNDLILALVLVQLIGIPCTLLFGRVAGRIGTKRAILLTLAVYTLISITAFFMQTATHFYGLALMVGTVQGGSQALSRSLFGSMVPRHKSAEFFGFFSTSGKFAGIAGPLLFGVVSQLTGQSRLSILMLVVFFILGALVLCRVDPAAGRAAARAAEAEVQ